jgi:WD40 repeat protein
LKLPQLNNLLSQLESTLKNFDPTTLMYADAHGQWLKNPKTLRDRISNELWFKVWEVNRKEQNIDQIKDIMEPFIHDENTWDVTVKLSKVKLQKETARENLFVIFEILYVLVEHTVNERNSNVYVAEWDTKGKVRKEQYAEKVQKFKQDVQLILGEDTKLKTLFKMIDQLKQKGGGTSDVIKLRGGIFNLVSLIISEEEKVRQWIDEMLTELEHTKEKYETYAIIGEHIDPEMRAITHVPQALLRSCLELLDNPNISVSSGLQFKSTSILGALKDLRCVDSFVRALGRFDFQYTNIRCNIIYALGNLTHKPALKYLIDVLKGPDFVEVYLSSGTQKYNQPLHWEKYEAIWALGKLGVEALEAVPTLMKFVNSRDREIKIALAWTLGTIGKEQRDKFGGIDANIVTALMNLLQANEGKVFEEVACSLKRLDLPDFLHSLYLHTMEAVPILALKPSSTGLYELSETIFHLVSIKTPVVMAVTGDSGTGKTYFCEAIKYGFGGLREDEILYLMRDNPAHLNLFNRMIGIKLLRDYVDPQYYQDYPLTDDADNPDEFFNNFLTQYSNKKLIILDGWMDRVYFYQAIRAFYEKGYLDIIVNFRTTFSTKRINLEEREGLLERVRTCLSYVEEPVIEDTEFYRDGNLLVYNLDNSIPSRLKHEDIREIFARKKVDAWGDVIRIGKFERAAVPLKTKEITVSLHSERIIPEIHGYILKDIQEFSPREASFSRILNEEVRNLPNLLQTIKIPDFTMSRIVFYTHGQIAYCGYDGSVGILFGLNDRIVYTDTHQCEAIALGVVRDDIYSIDTNGNMKITSFHKNSIMAILHNGAGARSMATKHTGQVITGHEDGTVRVWNIQSRELKVIKAHRGVVRAVALDRHGRVFSGGNDNTVKIWDMTNNTVTTIDIHASIKMIDTYPGGNVVIDAESDRENWIGILDAKTNVCKKFFISDRAIVNCIRAYFDGRIFASATEYINDRALSTVIVADPLSRPQYYTTIGTHGSDVRDCVTMGPRIISLGTENEHEHTIKIWGAERYVKMEHDKLKLMPSDKAKLPYYSTIF